MNRKRIPYVFPISASRTLAVSIVASVLSGWVPPDRASAAPAESARTWSAEDRVDVADVTEQALRRLESLSRQERIEESYLDLSLAVSRVADPDLNDRAIRSQVVAMGKAARSAWQEVAYPAVLGNVSCSASPERDFTDAEKDFCPFGHRGSRTHTCAGGVRGVGGHKDKKVCVCL
jgi:hypothetical protein